jgi:hypothetical protein
MRAATVVLVVFGTSCRPSEGLQPSSSAPVMPSAAPVPTSAASTTATGPARASPSTAPPAVVGFDALAADTRPEGFAFARTGSGAEGRWVVRADATAPSPPNVLAQVDDDATDYRFPVAALDAPRIADVVVRARCKPVSGKVDQACGVVARYQDADNYYLTRANALEGNVRLYFVKEGKRKQIASWSGPVTSGAWHELGLDVHGAHLSVHWDGQAVLEHDDDTFAGAGLAGLWTKADSVTYFDDLRVEPYR